jgi:hypothetical protein
MKEYVMMSNLKLAYFISITLRFETEEAKITAWENMQKVKAEAAIEKLVVSLSHAHLILECHC